MSNAKNKTSTKNANETTIEKIYRVADVARELKINEKRARSFLRKNPNVYAPFRNKSFTKNTPLYKQCVDALTAYAKRTAPVTE